MPGWELAPSPAIAGSLGRPTPARCRHRVLRVLGAVLAVDGGGPHHSDEPVGGVEQRIVSRLSNVVKRLEQREFVRREPDPTNGRYTNAILTDTGWECVVRAAPGHVNAVRHFIFDPLSAEQVAALREVSGLIAARIRCGTSSATELADLDSSDGAC